MLKYILSISLATFFFFFPYIECESNNLQPDTYTIIEISEIVPDIITTYRDETGGQDAMASVKITYKRAENSVIDIIDNALGDHLENVIVKKYTNSLNTDYLNAEKIELTSKIYNPLYGKNISQITSEYPNAHEFTVDYIKIEYTPGNIAPELPALTYQADWHIRHPDIYEWMGFIPVEVIKNFIIISSYDIDNHFLNYHNNTIKYDLKVMFFLTTYTDHKNTIVAAHYKVERNAELYINIFD